MASPRFENHRQIGKAAEEIACKFCQNIGYTIVSKNFHNRYGEIDVVAQDQNNVFIFIEVKSSRRSQAFPEINVTPKKVKQIYNTAKVWCAQNKIENHEMRFDVITVVFEKDKQHINHIKNAFIGSSWF